MARKDPIAHLSRHPGEIPPRLIREILDLGADGVTRLLAIVGGRGAWGPEGSPGWILAANAVRVLGAIRDPAAIPALAELLAEAAAGSALHARVVSALASLAGPAPPAGVAAARATLAGPALVEPLLSLPLDGRRRAEAAALLARCGVRDPRIRERLEELFEADPEEAANAAFRYGDPELAPAIRRAFDRIDRTRPITREEAMRAYRLTWALRALGIPDPEREGAALEMTLRAIASLRDENSVLEREIRDLSGLAELLPVRR